MSAALAPPESDLSAAENGRSERKQKEVMCVKCLNRRPSPGTTSMLYSRRAAFANLCAILRLLYVFRGRSPGLQAQFYPRARPAV